MAANAMALPAFDDRIYPHRVVLPVTSRPNQKVRETMRTIGWVQWLFAIASAALAVLMFAYGTFAPAAAPLAAWIPWQDVWIYGSASLVLAASFGLCFSRTAVTSVLVIGAYLAAWALIGVPQIFSDPLGFGGWYGTCEALSTLVGAWILYVMLRRRSDSPEMLVGRQRVLRPAQVLFGLTCVFYGASHFAYAEYTASMVPTWLPMPLPMAYLTGFFHIVAGIGLSVGLLPRLAATLEAIMMSLFGLLVWVPSFFAHPRPAWATSPQNQCSELTVNLALAASAWVVAASLRNRRWFFRRATRA
jgi:uncharacterized membrane protein